MKTTDTSLLTLKANEQQIVANKAAILNHYKQHPSEAFSAEDISMKFNMNRVHVSCRLSELLREGLITPVSIDEKSKTWYNKFQLTPDHLINSVKNEILKQDFKKWLNKGEKFKELMTMDLYFHLNLNCEML
jgi:predicted transcriptional regulator